MPCLIIKERRYCNIIRLIQQVCEEEETIEV